MLLRVRLSPLRERGRTTGWSVAFRVGPHVRTGGAAGVRRGRAAEPGLPLRRHVHDGGCRPRHRCVRNGGDCGERSGRFELPARVDGSVVRVHLPYRLLAADVRSGARLDDLQAWTRFSPQGTHGVGELDNVRARGSYRLPGAGRPAAPVAQQVDGSVATR